MYQTVVFCVGLYHFDAIRFAEFSTMSMRRRREECAAIGEHGQERQKKRCGDRREREERERKEAERRKGRPRKKESDRPRGVDPALRRQATPHQVRTGSAFQRPGRRGKRQRPFPCGKRRSHAASASVLRGGSAIEATDDQHERAAAASPRASQNREPRS